MSDGTGVGHSGTHGSRTPAVGHKHPCLKSPNADILYYGLAPMGTRGFNRISSCQIEISALIPLRGVRFIRALLSFLLRRTEGPALAAGTLRVRVDLGICVGGSDSGIPLVDREACLRLALSRWDSSVSRATETWCWARWLCNTDPTMLGGIAVMGIVLHRPRPPRDQGFSWDYIGRQPKAS